MRNVGLNACRTAGLADLQQYEQVTECLIELGRHSSDDLMRLKQYASEILSATEWASFWLPSIIAVVNRRPIDRRFANATRQSSLFSKGLGATSNPYQAMKKPPGKSPLFRRH